MKKVLVEIFFVVIYGLLWCAAPKLLKIELFGVIDWIIGLILLCVGNWIITPAIIKKLEL